MNVWLKKQGPTRLGMVRALAKGIFISGEPLVEYAEYLLGFNGHDRQTRLALYRKVARSDISDRLFERLKVAKDPDIQAILAGGFERAFEKALRLHEAEDTQQYAAAAMLAHWKERREYVLHVRSQAAEFCKKFWVESSEALETMNRVLARCESLRHAGWMQKDSWLDR
jgi:hypothetical protein